MRDATASPGITVIATGLTTRGAPDTAAAAATRRACTASSALNGLEAAGCPVRRPVGGGFYLWVRLPGSALLAGDVAEAASRGIFIAPSSAFSTTADPGPAMRINVAYGTHPVFLEWLRTRLAPDKRS